MKTKLNPIRFEITGKCDYWINSLQKLLENFTSEAGCIKICSQKYYYSSFPSVEDMTILREREVDQGNERFYRGSTPVSIWKCKTRKCLKETHSFQEFSNVVISKVRLFPSQKQKLWWKIFPKILYSSLMDTLTSMMDSGKAEDGILERCTDWNNKIRNIWS